MKLTKNSTYKQFQKTIFYKSMKEYVMTQAPYGSEPFTEQQAEGMMDSFYWRSHFNGNLEGIS